MNEVVIVGAARTPIGDFLGSMRSLEPVDLAVSAAKAAIGRSGVNPGDIKEVACGMIYKHGVKGNPGRQIQIKLGLPIEGYAYTVDQQCASGMKAVELASQSIILGKSDAAVAVGVESMSNSPHILKGLRTGFRMGNDPVLVDSMLHDGLICAMMGYHMGITAENLAKQYDVTREEQDELALLSHKRAAAARLSGLFADEIVPVTVKDKKQDILVDQDEHPDPDISMEKLSAMKPAFSKEGTVTAGNASAINDGAAAIVLMSAAKAKEAGITPLARLRSTANAGVDPSIMGISPVYAIPKALSYAGLVQKDIDCYEINEAFAAQFLACNRELKIDMEKVNRNGSGISLGHPVGCTGVRIIVSLIYEMRRNKYGLGVASLCVGGGPGMAAVIEAV